MFTAKGTVTHVVPPENVALVNQRPILRTDFIAQAEAELGKPFAEATVAERLKVLDEMLREELFVQRGLELDFPGTDPDTRTALVAAVEQQVVADVTTHQPADPELEKYFEENRRNYSTEGTMTLHNLLLPKAKASGPDALATAQKAADALRAHAPLAEVEKTFGVAGAGARACERRAILLRGEDLSRRRRLCARAHAQRRRRVGAGRRPPTAFTSSRWSSM